MQNSLHKFQKLSNAIRFLAADAVENAKSGHPGMPLGMADVATVLFKNHLKFNADCPSWDNRDRFVLSCGHGSMLLYALLYLTGYPGITIEDIKQFRQLHSTCAGHPEYGEIPGIETTTGPLGQGVANAVGMAIAEKHLRHTDKNIDHFTYVMVSDGDLMEGISHEALSLAGHLQLERLIVLYDYNEITIDGKLSLSCSDDVRKRFDSYHYDVQDINGHDYDAIDQALINAKQSQKPSIIICRTEIGHGAPGKAGSEKSHGSPLGKEVIDKMRENLNWPYPPFEIPDDILSDWRAIGRQHLADDKEAATLNFNFDISEIEALDKDMATRVASEKVLNYLTQKFDTLMLGSADLTPSNNTKTPFTNDFTAHTPEGRYIRYGIREHAMAAIMNGITLHGGLRAASGTFLCFTDYMRPAMRLSAMMKLPVIYIATHDSIGLGEDGPTHQPVEHLSSLRAIPDLHVYRPCDSIETAECWHIALNAAHPSVLCLTRQNVRLLRKVEPENLSQKGGYVLKEFGTTRDYVILATGSEVEIAHDVGEMLFSRHNKGSRIFSIPCLDQFLKEDYKTLLGQEKRIIIEAGHIMSWDCLLRENDLFFGVNDFGKSAPYKDVYRDFGLTAENILSIL